MSAEGEEHFGGLHLAFIIEAKIALRPLGGAEDGDAEEHQAGRGLIGLTGTCLIEDRAQSGAAAESQESQGESAQRGGAYLGSRAESQVRVADRVRREPQFTSLAA